MAVISSVYRHEMTTVAVTETPAVAYNRRQYNASGSPVYTTASYTVTRYPDAYSASVTARRMCNEMDRLTTVPAVVAELAVMYRNVSEYASLFRSEYLSETLYYLQKISMAVVSYDYHMERLARAETELAEVNAIYRRMNPIARYFNRKQHANRVAVAMTGVNAELEKTRQYGREIMNGMWTASCKFRQFTATITA